MKIIKNLAECCIYKMIYEEGEGQDHSHATEKY